MTTAMQEMTSEQWLNQIRDQVRSAFRGPNVSIPSVMGDWITREAKAVVSHRVPPAGMSRSERQEWRATAWNREVKASGTRNSGSSKPIEYRFPDGWVLRKVRQLPAEQGRLVRHLYAPHQGSHHAEWLAWHLWGKYEMDGKSAKTKQVIYEMYKLQLREMPNPFGWVGIMSKPWEHFGIQREAWKKYYRDHWISIQNQLVKMDEDALWTISE